MDILVCCTGFIGDILFASSLAKKLKEKYPGCKVTYSIPLPQPKLLLEQNPYIDHVHITDPHGRGRAGADWIYDMVIDIPTVDQAYPATIQMQAAAGIENQSLEFDVWTVPEHDAWALGHIAYTLSAYPASRDPDLWRVYNKYFDRDKWQRTDAPVIACQVDWAWRAYQCTPETLEQGIGAPHRDMPSVISQLRKDYLLMMVGYNRDKPSSDPYAQNDDMFSRNAASTIKRCDWFIGAEGGLSNLAAAVGTKCIITTDFIQQNYGPNGRVRKIENPQMGPAVYYPDAGHVHLDPCIKDDEIAAKIKEIIG